MDNTVALAAIGLAATSVGGFIWLVKFIAKTLAKAMIENTKASIRQTEASQEVLTFMKNLNGKLPKITAQRMEEKNKEK